MDLIKVDFGNEDELDDEFFKEFDELIEVIKQTAEEESNRGNKKIIIYNPVVGKCVIATYGIMKHLTKGTTSKVTYNIDKSFGGSNYVRVIGKELKFGNSDLFEIASILASNLEVYAKVDGTVEMTFGFNGMKTAVRLEEGNINE